METHQEIKENTVSKGLKVRKNIEASHYKKLEQHLFMWFSAIRNDGYPVMKPLLRDKAITINNELGGNPTFEASNKWINRFKKRYGIHRLPKRDKKNSIDFDAVKKFITDFQAFIETNNYDIENIYNAQETVINWRNLPRKLLDSYEENSWVGGKVQIDHLTALVCANAAGTHALPLLIIGRAAKRRSIEKILHSLPVEYISHKAALMTSSIFMNWFKEHFITLVKQRQKENGKNGKILLMLDNAPSHPSLDELNRIDNDIKVMYLPRNIATAIQPMNQGVIQKMKIVFRKNILQSILNTEIVLPNPPKYYVSLNVRKFCYMFADSFASLTSQNLRNAWQKLLSSVEETSTSDNENLLSEINDIFCRIPAFTDYPIESLQRWLIQDEFDPGHNYTELLDFVSTAKSPSEVRIEKFQSEGALGGISNIENWVKSDE